MWLRSFLSGILSLHLPGETSMPTMIIEGGRPARQKGAVALVYLSEIPAPPDIVGARYYNCIALEPNSKVNMGGMPGGILSVISNCPVTAVQCCYLNVRGFGWRPEAARNSRMPVEKIKTADPIQQVLPMAQVMQHLLAIQTVNISPEHLPGWLQLKGRSGRMFRPCGTAVGPRGACVGAPCPEGPCALNGGGNCVWNERASATAAPVPAPPVQAPGPEYSQPEPIDASEFAPSDPGDNGTPVRNEKGQFATKKAESKTADA